MLQDGDVIFYRFNPNSDTNFTVVTNNVIKEQYEEMMSFFESIVVAEKLAELEDRTVVIPENSGYDSWILILTYGDYGIQFEKRKYEQGLKIFIRSKVEFSARFMHNMKMENPKFEEAITKSIYNYLKELSSSIRKDIVFKNLELNKDYNFNYNFSSARLSYYFMFEFEAYPYFEYREIKTIRENYFDTIYKGFKNIIERLAEEK